MAIFALCDLTIESDEPFPELSLSDRGVADMRFRITAPPASMDEPWERLHCWEMPSGEIWLEICKRQTAYRLRFPNCANFVVSETNNTVSCQPALETPMDTIRHLFLDQVVPLVLGHRGDLVLHASAVSGPDGAVAFVGKSGCGKSTLAASFCERGFSLLTDDCFRLRERDGAFWAVPSYPGLRLWSDSLDGLGWEQMPHESVSHYSEKKRLYASNSRLPAAREEVPLSRLYLLTPAPESPQTELLEIASVRPQAALIELVRCAFCLDITDRDRIRKQFETLGRIAAGEKIFRLNFPHDFSRLDEVCNTILRNGEVR
jgi:hypothetical protein